MAASTSRWGCFAGIGFPQCGLWMPWMTPRTTTTNTSTTRVQPIPLAGSLPISINASAPRFVEPSGSAVDSAPVESSLFYYISELKQADK